MATLLVRRRFISGCEQGRAQACGDILPLGDHRIKDGRYRWDHPLAFRLHQHGACPDHRQATRQGDPPAAALIEDHQPRARFCGKRDRRRLAHVEMRGQIIRDRDCGDS
nr:hypothetical protein [Oscillochloris sp. ZM17-4]